MVHLIGRTIHDGEEDYLGGGPGGGGCKGFHHHIMSLERDMTDLYRMCKETELWSKCTIQQVKFYTADWTRFCPGSFFTHHEDPLYGLLILPVAAAIALAYYCYKKRSRKVKKLLEDETERLKAEAFLQSGGAYQDLTDSNANSQDPIREGSLLTGSQETAIGESL